MDDAEWREMANKPNWLPSHIRWNGNRYRYHRDTALGSEGPKVYWRKLPVRNNDKFIFTTRGPGQLYIIKSDDE